MTLINMMRAANLALGIVNIMMFLLWWSLIRVDAAPKGTTNPQDYILNQLSVGVTILGAIVTVSALVVAALSFFGFQAVIERAETRADKAARATATALAEEAVRNVLAQRGFSSAAPPAEATVLPDVGKTVEQKDE